MMLQYLSKTDDGTIETIEDNVTAVNVFDDKVEVTFNTQGDKYTVEFSKQHNQIYNMWLLNNEFKTLKRLI